MIIRRDEIENIPAPDGGVMRLHIVRPAGPGQFPGVLFFSEIYQVTEPIRRLAAMVAGQGYLVAMPRRTSDDPCAPGGGQRPLRMARSQRRPCFPEGRRTTLRSGSVSPSDRLDVGDVRADAEALRRSRRRVGGIEGNTGASP